MWGTHGQPPPSTLPLYRHLGTDWSRKSIDTYLWKMKSVYALGGIGLSIWAQIFLSSTITPVSAVKVKLPIDPTWVHHCKREANNVRALGEQIDYYREFMAKECPVNGPGHSLEKQKQAFTKANENWNLVVKEIEQTSGAERAKLLEKYGLASYPAALEISIRIRGLIMYFIEVGPQYRKYDGYLSKLTGYTYPNGNPQKNVAILCQLIDEGKLSRGDDNILYITHDTEGRERFTRRFLEILQTSEKSEKEMAAAMEWAVDKLKAPAFATLFGPEGTGGDAMASLTTAFAGTGGLGGIGDIQGAQGLQGIGGFGDGGDAAPQGGGGVAEGEEEIEVQEPWNTYTMQQHLRELEDWFECWGGFAGNVVELLKGMGEVPVPQSSGATINPDGNPDV
ncbi:hypothetical protein TWF281_011840 [Arthrobotrys megalospora]